MAMDVAPHRHIGLQTVSWLLAGEIVHDDSLQQEAVLRPGGVNVMTSGHAIAHAERTPDENTGRLNGVQLWTALPDRDRHGAASFQHLAEVPRIEPPGGIVQVFSGALADAISPATHFSDLVGADLQVHARHELALPLQRQYEHALLVLSGDCALEGQRLEERVLYYLGTQRSEMCLTSTATRGTTGRRTVASVRYLPTWAHASRRRRSYDWPSRTRSAEPRSGHARKQHVRQQRAADTHVRGDCATQADAVEEQEQHGNRAEYDTDASHGRVPLQAISLRPSGQVPSH
jgi:redox-sensitive bicupin YhaK (pirin superfamily)